MLDEKGYLYIIDAFLAVILLLTVFLIINTTISIPSPDYFYETHDIRTAQDTMELLSGRINSTDNTFLAEITKILEDGENSKESIREASRLCRDKFSEFDFENYRFSENNILNGKTLSSNGDYSKADNLSVATRNCGDYSYSLSVW